ncbi:uncharacterized protein [Nicotiana sylvestris]|uniref:uncharacterized protein n=1 Tax=Nicotiana sylvestris TaxID=4096 RepID=UPI00388CD848
MFTETNGAIREELLNNIPTILNQEENAELTKDPKLQEIKKVIFSMNSTNAAGSDGMDGIKKPNQGANMIIKLDMANAYDKVSWSYTCIVSQKNGILMLNNLTHDELFNGFYIERRGPQINHLSFADDVIIFTSGTKNSLNRIMTILIDYEDTSGQKINSSKSHFMVPSCVFHYNVTRIQQITGFTRKDSPLTYLGCPLYIGRKRIIHFNGLISQVVSRIRGWQGRLLSYSGKVTLIEKLTANFFWVMEKDKHKYHWASWENLQQTISITKVAWRKPQDNFVKIKSDGSALSNPGKIGAGTIIRDQHINFIHAMTTPWYNMALNNEPIGNVPLGENVDDDAMDGVPIEPQTNRRG